MTRTSALMRVVALTAIYLLVLTSLHPGDILTGVVLSGIFVAAARRIRPLGPSPAAPWFRRLVGVPALVGGTLVDVAVSTWRTALWCLNLRRTRPGLVTVPIPACGAPSAAAWGVRVGITPDTVVVDLDEERGRMLLHVIDARDPDAVRAEQLRSYERRQRRVFP
ncbi:Na+/H+ antiporter subunit E (plasmid) [Pseudonocardia bannensis]|uniref:Na+/H+ antiporter subunit E n=1 Tax=Pseudonocardia TaxID=1847 RepID=UPI0027E28399|nr:MULTISPECIES: Na+/H+ antiporter subunit E [Pseudonocardia]